MEAKFEKTTLRAIERWRINKTVLAKELGMAKSTFCNKLSPGHPAKFTIGERENLEKLLAHIGAELVSAGNTHRENEEDDFLNDIY